MNRQEANYKILSKITQVVASNPDLRFNQILQNIGVTVNGTDQFYEESEYTWERIVNK